MSRKQRHIQKQSTTTYEELYASIKRPTNATFIPKETMENYEEETCIRQENKIVYAESKLAQNTKAKRQAETACAVKVMEGQTVGLFA